MQQKLLTSQLAAICLAILGVYFCTVSKVAAAQNYLGFDVGNSLVPVASILHGGPPKDGIPALTDPELATVADFQYFDADERVIGLAIDGEARAYPIRILNWHEIINDRVAGHNVVITWCPLCGSGMVFDGNADGERLLFGVSGLLYNSDMLLYDRRTDSLWSQLMGQAIAGPLAGEQLRLVSAQHTSWGDWKSRYPKTKVINFNTGYRRDYGRDPYDRYNISNDIIYPVTAMDKRYHPKAVVAGLIAGEHSKAWLLEELEKNGAAQFTDSFAGKPVQVYYDKTHRSVRIHNADGEPLAVVIAYWFAWFTFYPDTAVYTPE